MNDIFISYSSKDVEVATLLESSLESLGYSVWRDRTSLHAGQAFASEIQNNLLASKCVIVLWSPDSVESKWVKAEAQLADEQGSLLTVTIRGAQPPLPYNIRHNEDLDKWDGEIEDTSFQRLLASVNNLCSQPSGKANSTPKFTFSKPVMAAAFLCLATVFGGGFHFYNQWENQLLNKELQTIGEKIYHNETSGKAENLITWNQSESFASLGIGHFIWYPADQAQPATETFPGLIEYMQAEKEGIVPDWLLSQVKQGALWDNKAQFEQARNSQKFNELLNFLRLTAGSQTEFMYQRLDNALPDMLEQVENHQRKRIQSRFELVQKSQGGLYVLIDYVNFKGEGTNLAERKKGEGWGLVQVLESMDDTYIDNDPLAEFARAADRVLTRRVINTPEDQKLMEQYRLFGWRNRLKTYSPEYKKRSLNFVINL